MYYQWIQLTIKSHIIKKFKQKRNHKISFVRINDINLQLNVIICYYTSRKNQQGSNPPLNKEKSIIEFVGDKVCDKLKVLPKFGIKIL